jgi:hypothetical protein
VLERLEDHRGGSPMRGLGQAKALGEGDGGIADTMGDQKAPGKPRDDGERRQPVHRRTRFGRERGQ